MKPSDQRLQNVMEKLLADGWLPAGQTAQNTFKTYTASGPGNQRQVTTGGRLRFAKDGCTLTIGKRTLFIWGRARDKRIAMADGVTSVLAQVHDYLNAPVSTDG